MLSLAIGFTLSYALWRSRLLAALGHLGLALIELLLQA